MRWASGSFEWDKRGKVSRMHWIDDNLATACGKKMLVVTHEERGNMAPWCRRCERVFEKEPTP